MSIDDLPPLVWNAPIPPEMFQQAIGVEQLGVPFDGNAHKFALLPPNAVMAIISVEGADIRFSETGDVVSGTVGVRFAAGTVMTLFSRRTLQAAAFASVGAGAATLNIIYYLYKSPDLEDLLTIYPNA